MLTRIAVQADPRIFMQNEAWDGAIGVDRRVSCRMPIQAKIARGRVPPPSQVACSRLNAFVEIIVGVA